MGKKLKPISECIDFEPSYVLEMFDENALFVENLEKVRMFCGKQGINTNSIIINENLLKKIARKMSDTKVKKESRLTLSAVQMALLEFKKNSKQKVLHLNLD